MKDCRHCGVALLGCVLAACAQVTPPAAPKTATNPGGVEVREHLSGRFVALIGPKAQRAPQYLDTPGTNFYCLRSFIDRQTGETAHQLYVVDSYDGERDWNAARDGAGQPLKFLQISRFKIACVDGDKGCSYATEFAANIPGNELRDSAKGLSVAFTDPAGDTETIDISANQIAAQLAAVEAQLKAARASAASQSTVHQP